MKINYVKIFGELNINEQTVYIFRPSRLISKGWESDCELILGPRVQDSQV